MLRNIPLVNEWIINHLPGNYILHDRKQAHATTENETGMMSALILINLNNPLFTRAGKILLIYDRLMTVVAQ
jgi:hypothetical protein